MQPRVTIIIPVYNNERYLAQCVQSAIDQTWQNKEIIIVDDGSTDGSLVVAKSFEWRGVQVIHQSNNGASVARNKGLTAASGEWVQFLDSDDVLAPTKIERQLNLLKDPQQVAVCKTIHFVGNESYAIDDDSFFQAHLQDPLQFLVKLYGGFDYKYGMVQPNAYLTSMQLIRKAGPWNENLSLDDDGEFFCRVVLASKEIVYDPAPLNHYRKYPQSSSLSGRKNLRSLQSQFESNRLKHQHLLHAAGNTAVVPHIHTATYKAMQVLAHLAYPRFPELVQQIEACCATLIKHPSRGKEVFGGQVANFLGNHVSWKLLKRMQGLRRVMQSKF